MITHELKNVELIVAFRDGTAKICFDYIPEEPMVSYYRNGSGYPGRQEYVEIFSIIDESGTEIENISIEESRFLEQEAEKHVHNLSRAQIEP